MRVYAGDAEREKIALARKRGQSPPAGMPLRAAVAAVVFSPVLLAFPRRLGLATKFPGIREPASLLPGIQLQS